MPKLKYKTHVKTKDFYDHYANTYFRERKGKKVMKLDRKTPYYISRTLYTSVLRALNLGVIDLILTEPLDCVLPNRLGIVCIRKKKPEITIDNKGDLVNKMPVNWKETRKLWKENPEHKGLKFIRHFNAHSNQYVAKFMWRNRHCNFTNRTAYSFIPNRAAKLKLSGIMLDEEREVDYFLMGLKHEERN